MYRFLATPRWVGLTLLLIVLIPAFYFLGKWQYSRYEARSAASERISANLKADPVPLERLDRIGGSVPKENAYRRVTATGRYLADAQVLVRLRSVEGEPAFEVLVPFAVDGGPTVLVNRGYVRPEQGSQVPPIGAPPTGPVTITARLRDSEPVADKEPVRQDGFPQVYSINTAQIAEVTGVPLAGSYLQLTEDQPGGLGVIGLPHLDAGPFLSYGIQWIAFGIIAPIGLGYFIYAEIRQRRRERAAHQEAAASTAPPTPEEKLADRYGRRRR